MKLDSGEILQKSKDIRIAVVKMVASAQASHLGSALSCVDILSVLFFGIMNVNPKEPKMKNRDRLILSKGHAGVGLLATLAHRGFFNISLLKKYCVDGSVFTGHTMLESAPGVEATTGSLGHGLPLGVGMALAAKSDGLKSKVFVVLSDGELDEGSNWEAIMAAGHLRLDNLVAILDYNKIQSFGMTKEVMDLEPLAKKWLDFNWAVVEVDGHNSKKLLEVFKKVPFKKDRPNCVIAHTVKGKGVSFMEDKLEWHYKSPNPDQLLRAIEELK